VRSPAVLILGGTSEARALAARLSAAGVAVTSSLAGRVANPALPVGSVRVGGFGGAEGLAAYLDTERVGLVVDATHPFATAISASAVTACASASVPLLRLARTGWSNHPDAASWRWVDSYPDAAAAAAEAGSRVLLTTGRSTLRHFTPLARHYVLVRLVAEPDHPLPPDWRLVRSRGPYTVDGERQLMASHGIEVLVTKDSGGQLTEPKLTAAAEVGVSVIVVRRPETRIPDEHSGEMHLVGTVQDAADWVFHRISGG
jgi:precorrin-6A/cobalt-precorrin-6A reductase